MKFIKRRIVAFVLISISCVCMASVHGARLTKLQIIPTTNGPALIFYTNHLNQYHVFTLSNPDRLVVDLFHTTLAVDVKKTDLKNSSIRSIHAGRHPNHQLRLVFDLSESIKVKTHVEQLKHQSSAQLIVEMGVVSHVSLSQSKKLTHYSSKKSQNKNVSQTLFKPVVTMNVESQKIPLHEVVVVIDPGHGGHDPGAIGLHGTREKRVVYAIAKDLYELLNKESNINPKLTRRGDYFVTLRKRLGLARRGHADLFVAIHADAYKNHYAHGASIFALSQRAATSEAARWLAQKENYSELGGVSGFDNKSYLVRSVLIDLSQTATIKDSLRLGAMIMSRLHRITRLHHGFVEQAPFIVLKSPDIPSLLVEVGFISNRREELRLRSSAYQHKIARAIELGIVNYLHRYPPPGTTLALEYKHNFHHVVKLHESLFLIAKKYGIELSVLKKINHLKKTSIHVGQVLVIPRV